MLTKTRERSFHLWSLGALPANSWSWERATLGHTMVRNWPQPLQNLFMLRFPGWIYYAEELQIGISGVFNMLGRVWWDVYGLPRMDLGRLIVDVHYAFPFQNIIHLGCLQSMAERALAGLHRRVGQAVANLKVCLIRMKELTENGPVPGNDLLARFQISYEHELEGRITCRYTPGFDATQLRMILSGYGANGWVTNHRQKATGRRPSGS